ncbi:MAG: T9SS type A sorting domain-containing protein [Flavobacteriales bacterium]
MKKIFLSLAVFSLFTGQLFSQFEYTVSLSQQDQVWPALQSFVWAKTDSKFLVAGGRTDGLHRRQPFASFDPAFNNSVMYVIDPTTGEAWNANLNALSQGIADQLSSSNMEFYQMDNLLICVGGYGYNTPTAGKVTFPNVLVIEVEETIDAIMNGDDVSPFIQQLTNQNLAVCGGHLESINNKLVLVGGHRFDGNYNPMNNPTFTQAYTSAIKSFTIEEVDGVYSIANYESFVDADLLHRRDYNLLASVDPNGENDLILFSGVFQATADLPYLDCVEIDNENTVSTIPNFSQYLNQYHTASMAMYSASNNQSAHIFFGGISQYYYDETGNLVNDVNVPFSKNISAVERNSSNEFSEFLVGQMPAYLGASAEFLPVNNEALWLANGVLNFDALTSTPTLVGYILGGIESSEANIFWINTGVESWASTKIYEVYITAGITESVEIAASSDPVQFRLFPNPTTDDIQIEFSMLRSAKVEVTWTNAEGKIVAVSDLGQLPNGKHQYLWTVPSDWASGQYLCSVRMNDEVKTIHVIIQK